MTTIEAVIIVLALLCLMEFIRTVRTWYEAEAKNYELAILRERNKKRMVKHDTRE